MRHPHISDTDLRLLRVLNAVLETNDVTRASEMLFVTPSAVSHSLRALRERFGDPLLVPTRGRMQPTPFAEALKSTLRDGLTQLTSVMNKEDTFQPALSTRSLSLAAPDYQLFLMMPAIIADIRQVAPSIDLRLRALDHDVLDQLAGGELDLVLAGSEVETTLALDREVMRTRIISEPFWCVMAHDNPAAVTEELTLAAYLAAPHVVTSTIGEESDAVDASLAGLGASRHKTVTVPSFLAAAWYAASSDMIATLPETVARRAAYRMGGIIRKAPLHLPNSVAYLWWHPRFHNDARHSWWRKLLIDAFAPYRLA